MTIFQVQFTAHKRTVFFTQAKTTTANQLVLYHACFAVPGVKTVNHAVLGWNCFAIIGDVLRLFCDSCNFLAIYLACFAGINEPNCMFLFFALLDVQSDYVRTQGTNSTVVLKTTVGFEMPRKRWWNTRFLWISLSIINEHLKSSKCRDIF